MNLRTHFRVACDQIGRRANDQIHLARSSNRIVRVNCSFEKPATVTTSSPGPVASVFESYL
jgi:hypothetical protein